MLRMNRHFASAATAFRVSGNAPSQNSLMFWAVSARRGDGFGKLVSVPGGYGAPNAGLAPAALAGDVSSFVATAGLGALTGSGAAGVGVAGAAAGQGEAVGLVAGLLWMTADADGAVALTGTLLGTGVVSGAGGGLSDVLGELFAAIGIQGTADGLGVADGTADLIVSAFALAEGSSTADGSLAALLAASGMTAGTGFSSAELVGLFLCVGTSVGAGAAEAGPMHGYGWIVGVAEGAGAGLLDPYAFGFMGGTTAIGEVGLSPADIVAVGVEAAERVWRYTR